MAEKWYAAWIYAPGQSEFPTPRRVHVADWDPEEGDFWHKDGNLSVDRSSLGGFSEPSYGLFTFSSEDKKVVQTVIDTSAAVRAAILEHWNQT